MLCFDYIQPSPDNLPLAIVRLRLGAGERLSAVGLVRCGSTVAAHLPKGVHGATRAFMTNTARPRPRAKFSLPEIKSHNEREWEANGLTVIQHIPLFGFLGQREYDHQNFGYAMFELLQHPMWTSACAAWRLNKSLHAALEAPRKSRL